MLAIQQKSYFIHQKILVHDFRKRHLVRSLLEIHGSPIPDAQALKGEPSPAMDFAQLAERFLIQANLASDNARSYRNFNVGAVAYVEVSPGIVGIFHGANMKLNPHSPKICAERVALEKAEQYRYEKVVGVAVFAPTQTDNDSGIELPVLHPCKDCRTMFSENPRVSEDLLIASANPQGQYEFTDLRTILAIHEEKLDPDSIVNTHRVPSSAAASVIQFTLAGWIPGRDDIVG